MQKEEYAMDFMESGRCECRPSCSAEQTHVHEVLGSVQIAEAATDPHNHSFAAVSDEVIPVGTDDHVHVLNFRTDFYENHFHGFCGRTQTQGAIPVGDGRHVHFLDSITKVSDGHRHRFRVATLINDPIKKDTRFKV